jgi:hypothetical protein
MRRALLLLSMAIFPAIVGAEIFKLAVPTDQGVEFYWWPVLTPIEGWEHDEGASRAQGVNAYVPTGASFANAPAIIYARAMFKPRIPETKSLGQLIADDRVTFTTEFPGTAIAELVPIVDGDGKKLRCFSFIPSKAGSWDLVAYGEEGEFYLIFTVSGHSKAALDHARGAFLKIISTYKERALTTGSNGRVDHNLSSSGPNARAVQPER